MAEKIKTGVIGCGKVGDFHARSFARLKESEFTAVYSRNFDRARAFAEKYGVKATRSIEEMAVMGVEAVSICTPHPNHAGPAVAALEAGMHVLVEKPFASTLRDCDRILDAARKAGKTAGAVCQRRFYAPCLRIREAIDAGKIGTPALGTVIMHGWRDEAYYGSDAWRGEWAGEGGGVLVNQAPHQIDLLLWYMGEVDSLYGFEANLNHAYIEVEDTAAASMRFKNGAIGNIVVSNSQNPALYGKVRVFGSNGASLGVKTDGGQMFIAGMTSITEPPVNDIWTVPGEEQYLETWVQEDSDFFNSVDSTYYFHDRQIENFLRSLSGSEKLLIPGEEGRRTVELFTAIYRSTALGEAIKFPLAPDDMDARRTAPRFRG